MIRVLLIILQNIRGRLSNGDTDSVFLLIGHTRCIQGVNTVMEETT